jgi:trimeric autotransporter adhesin
MRKIFTPFGAIALIIFAFAAPKLAAQPANNLICNATALTLGTPATGTNVGATTTGSPAIPAGTCWTDGSPSGGALNNDVWFSFVAPAQTSGTLRITTTAGGMTDSQVQVWRSTPASSCTGTLAIVVAGCNDDISGTNFMSEVNINVTNLNAGETYFVQVDGWLGDTGSFGITASFVQPPPPLNYPAAIAQNLITNYTDLGTNGSVITVANNDNATSAAQPIGFTFSYDNTNYTQFRLNTNGFIKLGSLAPSTDTLFRRYGNGLANTSGEIGGALFRGTPGDSAIIAAYGHDLHEGLGGPAEFRVQTSGTAPNRICVVQFKNLKDKPTISGGADIAVGLALPNYYANMRFQIKLYETSNRIELVYDTFTVASPAPANVIKTVEIGIVGRNATADQIRFVQKISAGAWSVASFQTSSTQNIFNMRPAGGYPDAPGRTFRFNQIKANDLGVRGIYSLGRLPRPQGNPVATQAAITNAGLNTQTAITVTLQITGANSFTNTKTIANLAPNASTVVQFDSFASTTNGTNNIRVFVNADDNRDNDTLLYSQQVNADTYSYARVGQPAISATGATSGGTGLFSNRYVASAPALINKVRVFIFNTAPNVGQTVYGVVTNAQGVILGQSANRVLQTSDLGTFVEFTINYSTFPLPFFTNSAFFVGMVHNSTGVQAFPMSNIVENPSRLGPAVSYFNGVGGAPSAIGDDRVWMIEAVTVDPTAPNQISTFNLLSPANNAIVSLTGQDTTTATIRWRRAIDGGGLPIGYQWLAAVGADFNNPAITLPSNNGGSDTTLTVRYVTIDDQLDALGFTTISCSTDIPLDWTVRAIAGANFRFASDTFGINFRRCGLLYTLCTPGNAANTNDFIDSVSINGATGTAIRFKSGRNLPSQYRNWFDTTGFGLSMLAGQTYQFRVRMGTLPAGQGPFTHQAIAFVDWNKNNRFDETNGRFTTDTLPSTSTIGALLTGNITVPTGTTNGAYRLRIIGGDVSGILTSCAVDFGDVEDYKLTVGPLGISISEWTEGEVELFPNPASGFVNIRFAFEKPTDVQLAVFSSVGARVLVQNEKGMTSNQVNLNIAGLAKGVYMVRMTTAEGVLSRRLVIE